MKNSHSTEHTHPKISRKKFPLHGLKSPSRIGRSQRPVHVTPLEVTRLDEVKQEGEGPDVIDPHFQSELDYGGFRNVEAYDNREYRLGNQAMENPEKELDFNESNSRPQF